MQKTVLYLLFIGLTLLLPFASAAAASPSPSASTSAISASDVTENIKKRLQESLDTATSAASPNFRAYVGIVRDVIKDTVVVEDKDGKKSVAASGDTVILRSPGNSPIKLEDIRIEDNIIAIGVPLSEDELTGRRLIVSTTPFVSVNKITGYGVVEKIGASTLTLKESDKTTLLTVTSKTVIKSNTSVSLDLSDLKVGDTLIYIALLDGTSTSAKSIMRIKTTSTAVPSPTP